VSADDIRISKTLSLWLRHEPSAGGLVLDAAGWTEVDAVLAALARKGMACDWAGLLQVVETNDKQRFELSADAARIRARQGHSVAVDLGWPEVPPPETLFHGTVERFLDAIMAEGLRPMSRHHVHLSPDIAAARRVGARRGRPVILEVAATRLTAHVPPEFLTLIEDMSGEA
jgi:putative RNA 2'-phosphotransferase